jgi:hypothetical protein
MNGRISHWKKVFLTFLLDNFELWVNSLCGECLAQRCLDASPEGHFPMISTRNGRLELVPNPNERQEPMEASSRSLLSSPSLPDDRRISRHLPPLSNRLFHPPPTFSI